jgi:hypothetical protein
MGSTLIDSLLQRERNKRDTINIYQLCQLRSSIMPPTVSNYLMTEMNHLQSWRLQWSVPLLGGTFVHITPCWDADQILTPDWYLAEHYRKFDQLFIVRGFATLAPRPKPILHLVCYRTQPLKNRVIAVEIDLRSSAVICPSVLLWLQSHKITTLGYNGL